MTESTLRLESAPSVLFLFGLAGSGKSYVGDLIARHTGWYVYHADEDITDDMRQALAEHLPFTEKMRDDYISIVLEKILTLRQQHRHLLVTQAVYKQRHREFLMSHISQMDMIHVQADDMVIEKRLLARAGEASTKSAAALRKDFELPQGEYKTLVNNEDDEAIVRQLNKFYSGATASV